MIVWNAIWGHSVIYGYDKDDCMDTRECNVMIVWTQGIAMLWLYGMIDEGIQLYLDMINMMCNVMIVLDIQSLSYGMKHKGMQCNDCMEC